MLLMVPGERISAKTILRSSKTTKVPFGDTEGRPPDVTEATNPNRTCSIQATAAALSIELISQFLCQKSDMCRSHLTATANNFRPDFGPLLGKGEIFRRTQICSRFQQIHRRMDRIKLLMNACESIGIGAQGKPVAGQDRQALRDRFRQGAIDQHRGWVK